MAGRVSIHVLFLLLISTPLWLPVAATRTSPQRFRRRAYSAQDVSVPCDASVPLAAIPWWFRRGRRITYCSKKTLRRSAAAFRQYIWHWFGGGIQSVLLGYVHVAAFAMYIRQCIVGCLSALLYAMAIGGSFPLCTYWFGYICLRCSIGDRGVKGLQHLVRAIPCGYLIKCCLAGDARVADTRHMAHSASPIARGK